MRNIWKIAAVVLAAPPAFAIPPPPPREAPPGATVYSAEQIEKTPPQALLRQLFADWARGLVDRPIAGAPTFYSRPRGTYFGVCQVTRVTFVMEWGDGPGRGHIEGMQLDEMFRPVDVGIPFDPTHIPALTATDTVCRALPVGTEYISAPSAMALSYQHHLIGDAVAQAKGASKLSFALHCNRGGPWKCDARKVLAALAPSAIRNVVKRDCAGYTLHECYEVQVGDRYLETESRLSTEGYSLTEPDRILVEVGVSDLPHDLAAVCSDCK
jgi:hypothetical protein